MQFDGERRAEHGITVPAPADTVYRLLADAEDWPQVFPPTVWVDRAGGSSVREERLRIWASAGDRLTGWVSRRWLDPRARRIDFRQEVPAPPVAAMSGGWRVEPLTDGTCHVRLLHGYRALDDDPADLERIEQAVDRNSRSELAALKAAAERATAPCDGSRLEIDDSVRIDAPAEEVHDFLRQAQHWPERLPHVLSVALREDMPDLQTVEMRTRAADGSVSTTVSARVCLPDRRIVYKQTLLPPLLAVHTGRWSIAETGRGVTLSSHHTVVIDLAGVTELFGPDVSLGTARTIVREAVSANSRITLDRARRHAERQR
ncbi:aromatase/cyclase [Streptomyces sp. NPDC005017]|uniref:aromatase/cyclase n=1 Tax=Streptomyces sp. NPDC005017 TaxID=3364706 RepID=UPI00369D4E9E